jgi:hypothetical protein
MKVKIIFCSMYGHIYRMGREVELSQLPDSKDVT